MEKGDYGQYKGKGRAVYSDGSRSSNEQNINL